MGINMFLPSPGDFLQCQACARVQGADAGTWRLQKMRFRAGSEQAGWVPGCCRWEEAAPVPMAYFDLGNCWSLSACELLLGCPGTAEEGMWLVQVGALRCKAGLCFERGNL